MTWEAVAQVLTLIAGALAASWWLEREPATGLGSGRRRVDLMYGKPPRGHRYRFNVTDAHCECGWLWEGTIYVGPARLRKEVGRHLAAVSEVGRR